MTITVANLIPAKLAEDSQTTQYTSDGAKTIIDKFTATNVGSVDVDFSVNLVPNNGSVGDSNLILDARTIAPGETYLCGELVAQVLEDGDFISTLASVASSLTIKASGRQIT